MMSLVSVVIPIYNVEQYLPKCLDSVINQTYKNLEIICVNDCSPDNSLDIIQKYSELDNRIKIVNREQNGGLSEARNSGLDAASGEYIYFLDSDDWIDLDYIEKMVDKITDLNVDMVLNTNVIAETETDSKPFIWYSYKKQCKEGEFLDKITAVNDSQVMICCHLYKKEFLDKYNLRFPAGYIHEDEFFQRTSKINLDKLFAFYGPAYHYLQRQNSIMSSRKNKIEACIKIFSLVYDFYKNTNLLSPENRVRIFQLDSICTIQNEKDFNMVKEYVNKIGADFEKNRLSSNHYEKYLYKKIKNSNTYEDYKKSIGQLGYFSYISRGKIYNSKNLKVSIIIPIYNTEKYLRKCLDFVCAQTLEDIEIICVNDCSTNNSLERLQEYAAKDNRIKILNFKENRGVAVARNEAIKIAKGEYIGFVDSDDWIDLDFYEKLYKKAKETNSELVIGNVKTSKDGYSACEDIYMDMALRKIKSNRLYFNHLFWLGLYNANLLREHSIKFIENCIYGEDALLPLQAAYYTNSLAFVDDTFYYYTRLATSIAKQPMTRSKMNSFVLSAKNILNFLNETELSQSDSICVYDNFIETCLGFSLELDEDLKTEFYNKFLDDIIVNINKNKSKGSHMYNDFVQTFNINDLKNFEKRVREYLIKKRFCCSDKI